MRFKRRRYYAETVRGKTLRLSSKGSAWVSHLTGVASCNRDKTCPLKASKNHPGFQNQLAQCHGQLYLISGDIRLSIRTECPTT